MKRLVALLMTLFALPVMAQTDTPTPTATPEPSLLYGGRYEENNPLISYTGSWGTLSSSDYSGNGAMSSAAGGVVDFYVTGDAISIVASAHSAGGIVQVCIDTSCTSINTYYDTGDVDNPEVFRVPYMVTFTAGTYPVTMTVQSGTFIFDAVDVMLTQQPTAAPTLTPFSSVVQVTVQPGDETTAFNASYDMSISTGEMVNAVLLFSLLCMGAVTMVTLGVKR